MFQEKQVEAVLLQWYFSCGPTVVNDPIIDCVSSLVCDDGAASEVEAEEPM